MGFGHLPRYTRYVFWCYVIEEETLARFLKEGSGRFLSYLLLHILFV